MSSKAIAVALAFLLGATSATFAAGLTNSTNTAPAPSTQKRHHVARTSQRPRSRQLYLYAPSGLEQNQTVPGGTEQGQAAASPGESARYAAIHDCSTKASKWSFSTWQTTQLAVYRDCMTAHDQVE